MVVIALNDHDEATNLQKLFDALNNPDEDYVGVENGPISSAIASTIEKLLLSTQHQKRWMVHLFRCWPENEEACTILTRAFYKAFSQGRIGRLILDRFDSTFEEGRDMLLAVFGTSGPNNGSQYNPMSLDVHCCLFDHTMIPHLQSWARDTATVLKLKIFGNCFRWPDTPTTTECIAKMFEQTREKPTDLEFCNVSLVGDMACLRDWEIKSLRIGVSIQVHTLSGLSSMAPSLEKLVINVYRNENITLTEMDMGIIALLEDPNCCLENLELSSERVENTFALALFEALSNIQSLKRLDIRRIIVDNPSIWHAMLTYLRSNLPSLKKLLAQDSMILEIPSAADDIYDVLRSENHTLEKFCFYDKYFEENRELQASVLPYLIRNRAGRRILLDEQVPPSLMAEVLGRTQQMEMENFYDINVEKSEVLCADATYHLVQEGLAAVFSSRKRQRTNSLGA